MAENMEAESDARESFYENISKINFTNASNQAINTNYLVYYGGEIFHSQSDVWSYYSGVTKQGHGPPRISSVTVSRFSTTITVRVFTGTKLDQIISLSIWYKEISPKQFHRSPLQWGTSTTSLVPSNTFNKTLYVIKEIIPIFKSLGGSENIFNLLNNCHNSIDKLGLAPKNKCGKNHSTDECTIKGRIPESTCINCASKRHVASWKGYPKFPEMLLRRGQKTSNGTKQNLSSFKSNCSTSKTFA
ncbi:hypothetical protein CEXT_586751 [Caerostris extrusa]|uniref:Site-specific DNA endonuclease n=1 Tax=Caerostris extrusa TaxID=172846 RepID=A0AAV4QTQ0_CAEEX|nr:hypothetical protein CEXT_586751 [Caerostris extrusa]